MGAPHHQPRLRRTPWSDKSDGGYATTIPSKFISDDERSLYLQSNVFCCGELKSRYNFNLRRMSLVPADPSPAENLPGKHNLATAPGTVAISKSPRPGCWIG